MSNRANPPKVHRNRNGLEPGEDGRLIGRDPRRMTPTALKLAGHMPKSPLEALREHCIDCCAGALGEVRKCTATSCASWPFRMGTNPWTPGPSMAQRRQRAAALERAAEEKNHRAPGRNFPGTAVAVGQYLPAASYEKSAPNISTAKDGAAAE